jgi:hypothetical protein
MTPPLVTLFLVGRLVGWLVANLYILTLKKETVMLAETFEIFNIRYGSFRKAEDVH